MKFINSLLGYPLGWIMWLCYKITSNYGVALFIFTLVTRIFMVPTAIKQQKTSAKMAMLRPKMTEIQTKYANNKEKLNEELMNLYQKEGYSPMAGCLPMLIQFPILFGLIDVIYKPMTHILRLSSEVIEIGANIVRATVADPAKIANHIQLYVINGVKHDPSVYSAMGDSAVSAIQSLNLNSFGIDLTTQPTWDMFKTIFTDFNPVLLIPIFSGITSLVMSIISLRTTAATTDPAAGASMKGMMLTMPIMSLVIAFQVPAGVGLYWAYSNLIGAVQSVIMNKIYNPREMAAKAQAEYEAQQEKERQERIEAKKKAKEGKLEDQTKAMTQKELNRRKLAEARQRDAERYGEEYADVTDEDLK
ncbi:YidC/Oxa1 family membrane protein insertase [Oscillospiraceae bacterium MB08-C2-2]|nr:YidC/Oxa1 family membrane protein insertase [Oscillospiraceae bacterium MB08-C2-2]